MKATSSFTVDGWDPQPFDDQARAPEGVQLSRTRIAKTFSGDIEGTGVVQSVMAVAPQGSAGYVGIELIVASVHGRSGSFVLQHAATADRGTQSGSWTIVPDSGTGELAGLSGTGEIIVTPEGDHTFILDYELTTG